MFGLLGGLLGGAARIGAVHAFEHPMFRESPLSGLLAQQKMRSAQNRSGGGLNSDNKEQPAQQPQDTQKAQQQAEQEFTQAPPEPASPPPPPQSKPAFVQEAAQAMEKRQEQATPPPAPQPTVTSGLLDSSTAQVDRPKLSQAPIPPAPVVVNQGAGISPTVQPADQAFPNAPQVQPTQATDKISEKPPRNMFEQQDGFPTRPIQFSQSKHTADLGFRMQGSGGPSSYAPQFSYSRR